ncbi:hypothetical protein ASF10_21445 [Flavobacterium sp. Leaf82]|jgi:hypothetical protein|uniref:hypothetical protein n=1 Tax=unclassified Flavobacterium TaxID=196869 RepID=UPI0006F28BD4|nr:hypothetical protein [Flavobacterium sp. Leaf82]KQO32143.1 hypothetical protein ASF10_21445 [Flavobacterium sp. Leaf82]
MKTRFFIAACVFFSFCFISCSTDDIYQETKSTSNDLKKEMPKYINENVYARANDTINASTDPEIINEEEGDPIIVRPIRVD